MVKSIRQSLDAVPFVPFDVVMSSGRHYAVPTRDHAGLNPKGTQVVIWFDDGSGVVVSSLHVVALEQSKPSDRSNDEGGGEHQS